MDSDQSNPTEDSAENPYASPNVVERPVTNSISKPVSILVIIGIAIATICSSGIAFCCTCIPIGAMSFNLHGPSSGFGNLMSYVAWGGGLLVGGLVGYGVARGLWRWYRPSNENIGEPEV